MLRLVCHTDRSHLGLWKENLGTSWVRIASIDLSIDLEAPASNVY